MLNYEKFLEKLSNRNTKLDWRNLESLLEEHVPYVLEDIKSGKSIEDISKVYKGIPFGSVPDLYIEDPKKHKRESSNTTNHYTIIMDNSEYWKDYPKRSESIICTTSIDKSNMYGETYLIFPLDTKSKFGIASDEDIWTSFNLSNFNNILKNDGIDMNIRSLGTLNRFLSSYFPNKFNGELSYEKLSKLITLDSLKKYEGEPMRWISKEMDRNNMNLFEWIESLLDPNRNDIKIDHYDNINKGDDSFEVWTDQPCLIVSRSKLYDFIKKYKSDVKL